MVVCYGDVRGNFNPEAKSLADFQMKYNIVGTEYIVSFINNSVNADACLWEFSDGTVSEEFNPVKIFKDNGRLYC